MSLRKDNISSFKSELEIKIPSFPEVITKLVPSIEYPGLTTLSGS